MEIQLKFKGNSESFVLQSRSSIETNWVDNFGIEKNKEGYVLHTKDNSIIILKNYEVLTKIDRLVASTLNQNIFFYERKTIDSMWQPSYWKGIFRNYRDEYIINRVASGSRGDILPVTKNGYPVAVFAAGNFAVAGKRHFSLYVEDLNEIDNLLILYVINYIRSLGFLGIDSLNVRYKLFYQLINRSALTKRHLEMLPKASRPSAWEAWLWWFMSAAIIGAISYISFRPLIVFLAVLIIYYGYTIVRNWREKNE